MAISSVHWSEKNMATRGKSRGSKLNAVHDRWVRFLSWMAVFALSLSLATSVQAHQAAVAAPSASPAPSVSKKALQVSGADEGSDAPSAARLKMPEVPAGFSSYDGGWIQMAYHPSLSARVRVLQEQADEAKAQLTTLLGRSVLKKVHVRVGRTAGEMETLAPKDVGFPRYASGVAYSELGLVLLTARSRHPGERHDLPEVFRHELAHIALHDAVAS